MKNILIIMLMAIFVLAACGNNDTNDTVSSENASENVEATNTNNTNDEESSSVEVDKKLLNVEVTLPQELLEDEKGDIDYDALKNDISEEGVKDISVNEDGSVTLKMSKKAHKEMMKELNENLQASIDEIVNDEEFASIKDIQANKKYTEFDLLVNQEAFENNFDGFVIFGLGIATMMYHAFDGSDLEQSKITFNLIDEATNEPFDEVIYPDALEDMGEE